MANEKIKIANRLFIASSRQSRHYGILKNAEIIYGRQSKNRTQPQKKVTFTGFCDEMEASVSKSNHKLSRNNSFELLEAKSPMNLNKSIAGTIPVSKDFSHVVKDPFFFTNRSSANSESIAKHAIASKELKNPFVDSKYNNFSF